MKYTTIWFTLFIALSACPFLYAGNTQQRKLSYQEQAYVDWLLTGKGKRPAIAPGDFRYDERLLPRLAAEPEEWRSRLYELNYFQRSYPLGRKWKPEEITETFRRAEALSDERHLKSRTIMSPPTEWKQRGPFGMERQCYPGIFYSGRVTCIDYQASSGLYVGTEAGGLWGPPLLYPLSDQLATLGIGAVAVDPANANRIFLGTGAYSPNLGSPSGIGLFLTTNHGKDWSLRSTPVTNSGTSKIIIAPWNINIVFAAGDMGIVKSTDGGISWRLVFGSNTSDLVASADSSVMLAGVRRKGTYRSLDQGETWFKLHGEIDWPSSVTGMIKIAIAPSNPKRAYVQITNSTNGQLLRVYRTDNDTAKPEPTWINVSPDPTLSGYLWGQGEMHDAIIVHPTNADLVWLGGGNLLKSTNGGTNWVENVIPHPDVFILYYRQSDNLLYVGTDGGIFTSDDDGSTWSSVLNQYLPTTIFSNISVCRTDDRVKYGASLDNSTEGTSITDSSKWMVSNVADGIDVAVDWSTPSTIFTTTQFSDLFRTTISGTDCICNGGNCSQWQYLNVNGGDYRTGWSQHVVQDPTNANWIYTNAGPYIYYSSNKGTNWTPVNLVEPSSATALKVTVNSDGTFLYGIRGSADYRLTGYQWDGSVGSPHWAVSPISDGTPNLVPWRVVPSLSNPDRAYAIFNNPDLTQRIFKTTNRGTSWTNITGDFSLGIRLLTIVESPSDSNILWIGTDLSIFKSTNGGTNWGWWYKGMPRATIISDLEYVQSVEGDYLVAGTFGRSTFERDVNAPFYTFTSSGRSSFGFAGLGDFVVGPSDSAYVAVSTDRGDSWVSILTPSPGGLHAAHVFDSMRVIAVGDGGGIVYSADGGGIWSPISSQTQTNLHDVVFPTPLEGFAVGEFGTIIHSTDGGSSWQTSTTGTNQSLHSIFFNNQLEGWISGTDNTGQIPLVLLLHTTDGGINWIPSQGVGPGGGCDITFPAPMTGFLTLEGGAMLKTSDGGNTWTQLQTGTQQSLHDMLFIDVNNGWACGGGGTLIHTSNGGSTWTLETTETVEDLYAIFRIDDRLLLGGTTGLRSRPLNLPATVLYNFSSGWNMLSVPLAVENDSKAVLFPNASSNAFAYIGQYVIETNLSNGRGFWVKFPSDQEIAMNGFPITQQEIKVTEGWNLIGSISNPVPVAAITSDPPGIVTSEFFGYDGTYYVSSNIEPGRAYWAKANDSGWITLMSGARVSDDSFRISPSVIANLSDSLFGSFNALRFKDNDGRKQTLYFVAGVADNEALLERFNLPPIPPPGAVDVRFSTNRLVEVMKEGEQKRLRILIAGVSFPLQVAWEMKEALDYASLLVDGCELKLQGKGSTIMKVMPSQIDLRLQLTSVKGNIPTTFSLEQNYPNPFNPLTVIRYQLPVRSHVILKIYDVLGQEVTTLVDDLQEPGYKTAEWNVQNLSSGVFFYRLKAGNFTDTRKMLIIR